MAEERRSRLRDWLARRRGPRDDARTGPKVWLLMYAAHAHDGVARTAINLANSLVATRDVEIVSVVRARAASTFPIDPRVRVTHLTPRPADLTPEQQQLAARPRSVLRAGKGFNALTDHEMRRVFARMAPGDVLITSRPSLHGAVDALAPETDVIRIGWDHLNFESRYGSGVGETLDAAINQLDAFVVLTEADALDYRARHPKARVEVIRNAVSWSPAATRGAHDQRVVVAAGRLMQAKGFERMIEAWTLLAEEFPDWTLRIYGKGELRDELQAQIDAAGVRVELCGHTDDMSGVLAGAAALVMSSRKEGFPMVLLEALAEGLPMVSFDCPRGPGEIIRDGSNGFLVPDGDVPALAEALRRVLRDPALRDRLGEQAHRDAHDYTIEKITRDWTDLMDQLTQERARG